MSVSGTPSRPLLALTAAVLAAHLWALNGVPRAFRLPGSEGPKTLITRTLPIAPPGAEAADAKVGPAIASATALPAPRAVAVKRASSAEEPAAPGAAGAPAASTAPPPTSSAAASTVFAIPGSVLLRYKVAVHSRNLLWQADSELHWRHDGSEYEAKLELSGPLFPSRTQRSSGRITREGLSPLRFSDKARTEEATHFQRELGKVTFSSNRPDAILMAGAQDRLSVMLQLAAIIGGRPQQFGAGAVIEVQTAGTRDAEAWQFTVDGEEKLQLPGGTVTALKLTRNPRKEFDQRIELWLAPGMDYVPVRLRLTQPNGDWVDQQWSSTDRG